MASSSAARRRAADPPPEAHLKLVEKPVGADIADVRAFAAELPDKFLHCRDLGHNWMPRQGGRYRDGGQRQMHRCSRCGTVRKRELDPLGMIMSSQYRHPDGYLLDGLGRIVGEGRGALRLEVGARTIPADEYIEDDGSWEITMVKPKKKVAKKATQKKGASRG